MKIDIEFLYGDQITWVRAGSAFAPEKWKVVLLKGLNGKIAFLSFEPRELKCPAKSFAPVVIGVLVGALIE